jgi:hypothetical protein
VVSSADEFLEKIPEDVNMFLTISAIEHFDNDLSFFQQIREFVDNKKKPVVQVHLFPSPVCMFLYPLHGIRQYNNRSLGKITTIFKDLNSDVVAHYLGGKNCNLLHLSKITRSLFPLQRDFRKSDPAKYRNMCYDAVRKDCNHKTVFPTFYALEIKSNIDKWSQGTS